jgi:predicted AAA+ superfamily ATPase
MPHSRKRQMISILQKRLRFFPIVALQGARQTGKSFFAQQLWAPLYRKSRYVTFDDEGVRSAATESSKTFLTENEESMPFFIDEAQKVPALFDALKLKVDQKKVPGKYVILGSTEFSRQALIRESLTGRMGKVRIFPLTLAECIGLEHPRSAEQLELLKYLERGGLPGICFVREEANRAALFQDWVDLTCYRDLQQFKKLKLGGELAYQILRQTALLKEPTQSEIANTLKVNSRKVATHLEALKQLFVITALNPHPSGTGKTIFIPFDSGVAHFLGADRTRCLQIWLLNERLVYDSCFHQKRSSFFYYRSTGKKMIHLVEEKADQKIVAFQVITHEAIKKIDSELMKAFLNKNKKAKGFVLAPLSEKLKLNQVQYLPWESATEI